MSSKQTISFCISFAILCIGCIFSTQMRIFDALIQSKWFAFYFIVCGIGLFFGYSRKKEYKFRIADIAVGFIITYLYTICYPTILWTFGLIYCPYYPYIMYLDCEDAACHLRLQHGLCYYAASDYLFGGCHK